MPETTRRRGRPSQLTLQTVMDKALYLLDAEGPGALTIRGVARLCNVTPMALYKHVTSVDDLERLAVRNALGEMQPTPIADDPRETVKAMFKNVRRTILSHPGAAAIFVRRVISSPDLFEGTGRLLRVLESAGFSDQEVFDLYETAWVFTYGSIAFEVANRGSARLELLKQELSPEGEATIARYWGRYSDRDANRQFEVGIDRILNAFFETKMPDKQERKS